MNWLKRNWLRGTDATFRRWEREVKTGATNMDFITFKFSVALSEVIGKKAATP